MHSNKCIMFISLILTVWVFHTFTLVFIYSIECLPACLPACLTDCKYEQESKSGNIFYLIYLLVNSLAIRDTCWKLLIAFKIKFFFHLTLKLKIFSASSSISSSINGKKREIKKKHSTGNLNRINRNRKHVTYYYYYYVHELNCKSVSS